MTVKKMIFSFKEPGPIMYGTLYILHHVTESLKKHIEISVSATAIASAPAHNIVFPSNEFSAFKRTISESLKENCRTLVNISGQKIKDEDSKPSPDTNLFYIPESSIMKENQEANLFNLLLDIEEDRESILELIGLPVTFVQRDLYDDALFDKTVPGLYVIVNNGQLAALIAKHETYKLKGGRPFLHPLDPEIPEMPMLRWYGQRVGGAYASQPLQVALPYPSDGNDFVALAIECQPIPTVFAKIPASVPHIDTTATQAAAPSKAYLTPMFRDGDTSDDELEISASSASNKKQNLEATDTDVSMSRAASTLSSTNENRASDSAMSSSTDSKHLLSIGLSPEKEEKPKITDEAQARDAIASAFYTPMNPTKPQAISPGRRGTQLPVSPMPI